MLLGCRVKAKLMNFTSSWAPSHPRVTNNFLLSSSSSNNNKVSTRLVHLRSSYTDTLT